MKPAMKCLPSRWLGKRRARPWRVEKREGGNACCAEKRHLFASVLEP